MKIFKCVIKVYCQNCLLHLRFSTCRQELNPKELKYFDQGHWSIQWKRFVAHATQSNDKSTPNSCRGIWWSLKQNLPEWVGRCNHTHLQGSLCSSWKQLCSKSLLGTPDTVPYSKMGYNSLQGMAGLCCSPPRSNVQVDMVHHWLLSSKKNTIVTVYKLKRVALQKDLCQILKVKRMRHVVWNTVLNPQSLRLHIYPFPK